MLAACAPKVYDKMFKISFEIVFNTDVHNVEDAVEKLVHFGLLLKIDH